MTALTDAIRSHFVTCVDAGRFDGDGLDTLLSEVESAQFRLAEIEHLREPPNRLRDLEAAHLAFAGAQANLAEQRLEILKGNADLEQPAHDAHVRTMEAREVARRV